MKRQPPPLRFLALVLGLWVCARGAVLAPHWWVEQGEAAPADEALAPPPASSLARAAPAADAAAAPAVAVAALDAAPGAIPAFAARPKPAPLAPPPLRLVEIDSILLPNARPRAGARFVPASRPQRPRDARPGRWSGSAWALLRDDGPPALAPGGMLGGSQAGVRISWRVNGDAARPLALGARLNAPLRDRRGAEAAVGIEWQPLAALPVRLLAERRQALGRDGRSAFALMLHGGVSERPLPGGLRLDAYGQAGVVGARSRDLFADGAARVTVPAGRLALGAGLWGGAQPGVSRLDAGPHASIRLPLAGEAVRLSAEWRFRLAGRARPGSGPVLTLGSDF